MESEALTRFLSRRFATIPDAARRMGINIMATRGTGKTRLLPRSIISQDLLRGIPLVFHDPLGAGIDSALDKIARQPLAIQKTLWPRVRLVDTAGVGGRITPLPLYLRSPDSSFFDASQPLLETIRRLDPFLVTASIQGWNALSRIGTIVGMVLSGLNLQVTEAQELLTRPEAWANRLRTLAAEQPELAPAVEFLLGEYLPLPSRERQTLAASFLGKISPLTLDPTHRAIFGADSPGIDWQEVIDKSLCVFLDYRNEKSEELLRFKLVWLLRSLLTFIKARGPNRGKPLSLVMDEITFLLSPQAMSADLLTADMEELVNRLSRNNNVWLTAACQELYQLPEQIRKTFLTLGTQILGATTDRDAALFLAQRFYPYDPYRIKKVEAVYASSLGNIEVIDHRTVEFDKTEQDELNARRFLNLPPFTFLVGTAQAEGRVATRLKRMSIARLDSGQYVNEPLVEQIRDLLIRRDGVLVADMLSRIEERRQAALPNATPKAVLPAPSPGQLPSRTRRSEPVTRNDTQRWA